MSRLQCASTSLPRHSRITRHFDHVIDVNVIVSVDKLKQKIEANVHLRGKDIFVESHDGDMYAGYRLARRTNWTGKSSSTRKSITSTVAREYPAWTKRTFDATANSQCVYEAV